jgi:hypothetical protein
MGGLKPALRCGSASGGFAVTLDAFPMSASELLVLLVAVLVLWIVLKLAKVAIKMILFIIVIAVIAGALWLFIPR